MTREDFNMMAWASSRHPNTPYKVKRTHKAKKRKEMPEEFYMFILSVIIFLLTCILVFLYC